MAGIVSASNAQVVTATEEVFKLYRILRDLTQGNGRYRGGPTTLLAGDVTLIDAQVDTTAAAIAAINT